MSSPPTHDVNLTAGAGRRRPSLSPSRFSPLLPSRKAAASVAATGTATEHKWLRVSDRLLEIDSCDLLAGPLNVCIAQLAPLASHASRNHHGRIG
jgi:hypothetical protein